MENFENPPPSYDELVKKQINVDSKQALPSAPVPSGRWLEDEDMWVKVHHADPFPQNSVIALHDSQSVADPTLQTMHVAMWFHNNEPVFGRAYNNHGVVHAWFPYGGSESSSNSEARKFKMLTYVGPPKQNFAYEWIPVSMLPTSSARPLQVGAYCPAVVQNVELEFFSAYVLGKANLTRKMSWMGYAGREKHFTGEMFEATRILCRVPI